MPSDVDLVAHKIVQRYAHPERKAYLYMFRLKPASDFSAIVPAPENILAAWIDEGNGLLPAAVDSALVACSAAREPHTNPRAPGKLTSHERRQLMARSVLFSVEATAPDLIEVRLSSRALTFSPKGDREVLERWQRTGAEWYSAYQPGPD